MGLLQSESVPEEVKSWVGVLVGKHVPCLRIGSSSCLELA